MKNLNVLEAAQQSGATTAAAIKSLKSNEKKVVKSFKKDKDVKTVKTTASQPAVVKEKTTAEVIVNKPAPKNDNIVGVSNSNKITPTPTPTPVNKKFTVEYVSANSIDHALTVKGNIGRVDKKGEVTMKDLGTISTMSLDYCRDKEDRINEYKELIKIVLNSRKKLEENFNSLKKFTIILLTQLTQLNEKLAAGYYPNGVNNFLRNISYILYNTKQKSLKIDNYSTSINYDYFVNEKYKVSFTNNFTSIDKLLEQIEEIDENDYRFGQIVRLYFNLYECLWSTRTILEMEATIVPTLDLHGNINKFSAKDELEYLKSRSFDRNKDISGGYLTAVPYLDMVFYKIGPGGAIKNVLNELCYRDNKSIIITSQVSQDDDSGIKALKETLNATQNYFANNKVLNKRYWGNFMLAYRQSLRALSFSKVIVQSGVSPDTGSVFYTIWRKDDSLDW
jgi:hypothetical protein